MILFSELVEPVHQIGPNHLKQIVAREAQIYKLLNNNCLSDAWQALRLEMSQNTSVSDPMMNQSFSSHWTDSDRRPMSHWYTHAWTEHLNKGAKLKLWLLMVYVIRLVDED